MPSIKVNYSQEDVINTWFNLSVQTRESYLTFNDPGLITTINCLNTSLFLTNKNNEVLTMKILEGNYPLLDAMDIYWGDQCKLQMNKGLLKGRKLIVLVTELWSDFLVGEKALYLDMKLMIGIFDLERINSWKAFQISICKLIEQSLLIAQFDSLKIDAEKSAMKILNPKARKPRKKKKKTHTVEEEVEKETNLKFPAGVFFDMDSFLIDMNSETSTQASTEIEPDPEKFFFDEKLSGSRSYELRKKYSKIEMEWDEEMLDILYLSQYEGSYLKDLYQISNFPEIPVVVNYYNSHPSVFYIKPEDMNAWTLDPYNIIQRYI